MDNREFKDLFVEYLEIIGKFIGTYGLAVFLVVFYVTTLYDSQQEERKEWIQEITKIRYLVDPKSKTLTDEQAEKILKISLESFIQQLNSNSFNASSFGAFGYAVGAGFGGGIGGMGQPTEAYIQLFENEYKYSLDTAKSTSEQTTELNNLIFKFNSDLEKKIEESKRRMEEVYTSSASQFELVSTLLSQLRTENRDLKVIWNDIEKGGESNWIDLVSNLREISYQNELDNFRRFIQNHPNHPEIQLDLKEIGIVKEFGVRSISLNEALSEIKEYYNSKIQESISYKNE